MTDTIPIQHGSYLTPSFETATVGDAMHPGILSCRAEASATDVARMMATHHIHCIAVMGSAHGHSGETLVWGIVSDLDLVRAGVRDGGDDTAASLAQQPVILVRPTTPLREAAEAMIIHRVDHLVVIEPEPQQRPIGILSALDIAGVLAWGEG